MPDVSEGRASGREWTALAASVVLLGGAASLALGPDANFDLLNYHLYNGYAFLAGRLDRDLLPAGPASCFNPLLDALHYVGIDHLSPKTFAAVLGAIQATNVLLVWVVARALLGGGPWPAVVAALLAASGQNALGLLGTTHGDNLVSIPALGAVVATVSVERPGRARLFLAGALGGAAMGLKLTMAAPHVGLATLATWVAWRQRRPTLLAAFALGSMIGWGVTEGWWAFEMWRRLANPLFPFVNDVFRSPFAAPGPLRDPRWAARSPAEYLLPAVDAALGRYERIQEVPARDPRLLLVFVSLIPWLWSQLARVRAGQTDAGTGRGLVLYWIAGYVAWVAAFHYYRYAMVLEVLAPTLAFVLLAEVWPGRMPAVVLAVAAALLLSTEVNPWYRARQWSRFWFKPRLPEIGLREGQLVLLPDPGTSFVAPFFPPDAAFVGLSYPTLRGPALNEAIAARIGAHTGPLHTLVSVPGAEERAREAVRPSGLEMDGPCAWVRLGRGYRYLLCPLERTGTTSLRPQQP